MSFRRFRALLAGLLCTFATTASAGTICGTVTDRQTSQPIARAGVFVRTPAGAYTGFHGATDSLGAFCIANLAAGIYDLEVKVDDYRVAYLRGVVVTESTIDVEVPADAPALAMAAPLPNPARTGTASVRIRWSAARPAHTSLSIHDVRGRLLRAFARTLLPAGDHAYDWNMRDGEGRVLPAGSYFVRLDADGARRTRRVVLAP